MLDQKNQKDMYLSFNASLKMPINGKFNYANDQKAVELYMNSHILQNLKKFKSTKERILFLIENNYYEKELVKKYSMEQITKLTKMAYSYKHTFPSFMGAIKFFNTYALKTFDNKQYLETYEDRVVMNALFLGGASFERAVKVLESIMTGRFQPATPTFLNAGRQQRGEFVSCYLLRIEDNMESISRGITSSLQLSKRGGGVSLCLTNLREFGAPIKNIENQSTGIIPVMKLLEDSFSYANQLGQRQGAGAVYLNVHHPDILTFLDTKRENADEKIRIKSLSLGVIIPDITFDLAKANKEMALFSPYDVEKVYKKPFSDISITEEYQNMLNNSKIKKTYISAREIFHIIADLQFESGYPYIMFDDTVNNDLAHPGRVTMSNLCSEITQVSTISKYNEDQSYAKVGQDICCNLGSVNIAKMIESGKDFGSTIETSIRSLDFISRNSGFASVPSVEKGNKLNHAIGLGAMNLHGFLATNHIYYASPEAVDFTNVFFYTMAYYAFRASWKLAKEYKKPFVDFEKSKFADGSYFKKYTSFKADRWHPKTSKIKLIFDKYNISIPSQEDWKELADNIKKDGIANAYLMAVAPTGSISYLSSCTPSLQPIVEAIETRKESKVGRIYFPAYKINNKNQKYYQDNAYSMGPKPIIDIVAAAQEHVDQAISLTLFFNDTSTTRDLNRAYIYAFKKKCKTIYYVRVKQDVLEGSESYNEDIGTCTMGCVI